jgi:organic hydroperoxide reductase OsmC/OhrA
MNPSSMQVSVTGRYVREGSVLGGDIKSYCHSVRTQVSIEADEAPDRIKQLVRLAEASCFTLGALRSQVPVALEAAANGSRLELESGD